MTAKKKKKMDIPQLYSQLEYGHIEKEKGNFAYVLTILVLSILVTIIDIHLAKSEYSREVYCYNIASGPLRGDRKESGVTSGDTVVGTDGN